MKIDSFGGNVKGRQQTHFLIIKPRKCLHWYGPPDSEGVVMMIRMMMRIILIKTTLAHPQQTREKSPPKTTRIVFLISVLLRGRLYSSFV